MKLLTANFITCAVKTCKSSPLSFPLHFRDAELEQRELDYNPVFLANILPRLDWDAIKAVAAELGFSTLPTEKPVLLRPPPPPPFIGLQQSQEEVEEEGEEGGGEAAPSPSSSKPPSLADAEMDEERQSMRDASATMSASSSSSLNQPPTTNAALESQESQEEEEEEEEEKIMRNLHTLLLETEVMEGKLVCGNCGHEYRIKEGIANFLLPAHLV